MSTDSHEREVSDGGVAPSAPWVLRLERLV